MSTSTSKNDYESNNNDKFNNDKFYITHMKGVELILLKRYTIKELIGSGSQGFVVKAYDEVEKCEVAIKKLTRPFNNSVAARKDYRELSILNLHNHPNFIKPLNIYTPQQNLNLFNELYLVTEFAQNSLLTVMYNRNEKLENNKISFLLYQSLCAINHLNQIGVIHGQLKPENFLINNQCVLKLIDFGLSKEAQTINTLHHNHQTTDKQYRAPELMFGMPYDFRVDIWSLGCIFTELLIANEKPTIKRLNLFHGTDHNEQWLKIIEKLGTPSKTFIEKTKFPGWISKFPYFEAKEWSEILPDSCFLNEEKSSYFSAQMARNMISRMLKIDAEERCTILEAFEDPYINCWREDNEINAKPKDLYDKSIECNKNLDTNDWKELIFKQVKQYEQIHDIFGETNEKITFNDNN